MTWLDVLAIKKTQLPQEGRLHRSFSMSKDMRVTSNCHV